MNMRKVLVFISLGILLVACSLQDDRGLTVEECLMEFFVNEDFCRDHISDDVEVNALTEPADQAKKADIDAVIDVVNEVKMIPAQDSIIHQVVRNDEFVAYEVITMDRQWCYSFVFRLSDDIPQLKGVYYIKPKTQAVKANDFSILELSNSFNNSADFRSSILNDSIKGKDYTSSNAPSDFSYAWSVDDAASWVDLFCADRQSMHLTQNVYYSDIDQAKIVFKSDPAQRTMAVWGAILGLEKVDNKWTLKKLVVSNENNLPEGDNLYFDECRIHEMENNWIGDFWEKTTEVVDAVPIVPID